MITMTLHKVFSGKRTIVARIPESVMVCIQNTCIIQSQYHDNECEYILSTLHLSFRIFHSHGATSFCATILIYAKNE